MGQYIAHWIQQQIKSLHKNKKILLQVGPGQYKLGNYSIQLEKDFWTVYDHDRYVHDFLSLIAAVLYCLYHRSNELQQAQYLLDLDRRLSSLINEKNSYISKIKNSKSDTDRQQLCRARLSETQQRINMLSTQMQKILITAKYKKIREIL